jgi:hypothetical protein
VILPVFIFFTKVLVTAVILPNFYHINKNIFFGLFLAKILVGSFAEIMYAISSQRRVR